MIVNAQVVVLFLFALGVCQAQLATEGRWTPRTFATSQNQHVLPSLDNARLLSINNDKLNTHGGYEFAHVFNYTVGFHNWGPPTVLKNGDRVWSTTLVSETALSISVTFRDFRIPIGGELYLIGAGDKVRGAFTSINNPENGWLTTFPLEGSFLTLEYYQPAHLKSLPSLDIVMVAHGYRMPLCFQCSGTCNVNAACDDEWKDQIRSVGMLLTSFGSRFCSGSLVNNARQNGDQLFLTAFHCQAGPSDQVMLRYQSPVCTPNTNGPTTNVVGRLAVLARDSRSDFLLMRINDPIPADWEVYLSGISGQNVAPSSMVGIHHPSGDIKKICYANKAGTPTRWSGSEPGNWHWQVASWDKGTTEPGSSGSPLFDQNKRVVGQLHGGIASCSTIGYDSYGAAWASWPLGMGSFLDPGNTGTLIVDGAELNNLRLQFNATF